MPRHIFCELSEMEALLSHKNCDFYLFSKILNTGRIQINIQKCGEVSFRCSTAEFRLDQLYINILKSTIKLGRITTCI